MVNRTSLSYFWTSSAWGRLFHHGSGETTWTVVSRRTGEFPLHVTSAIVYRPHCLVDDRGGSHSGAKPVVTLSHGLLGQISASLASLDLERCGLETWIGGLTHDKVPTTTTELSISDLTIYYFSTETDSYTTTASYFTTEIDTTTASLSLQLSLNSNVDYFQTTSISDIATTYISTITYNTSYPVTVTSDSTLYEVSYTTSYITLLSTITDTYTTTFESTETDSFTTSVRLFFFLWKPLLTASRSQSQQPPHLTLNPTSVRFSMFWMHIY